MKPEDFLSDDFLKQFKTGQQRNEFLGQIQKRAIEKVLEGELDGHLGYEKNEQSKSKNARNGYRKRRSKPNTENQRLYSCTATISRITSRVAEDIVVWQN